MPLVGYWSLNETSGSTAYDRSGQNNHGTLNGGITQGANGILGNNAYQLDGTDDYVDISGEYSTGPITISTWVKINTIQRQRIVNLADPSICLEQRDYNSDGNMALACYVYDGSDTYYAEPSWEPKTGQWYHYIGIYDAANNKIRVYINGVLEDTASQDGIANQSLSDAIGASRDGSNYNFDGSIAEVRIYNHALTPAEVQYLYQVGKRGKMITDKRTS
jgi:hypothetical protein